MQAAELPRQRSVRWAPDGSRLAAASLSRVLVREVTGTLELAQVFACEAQVTAVEWSPDSEYVLAEIPERGLVQVFRLADPEWCCRIETSLSGLSHAFWGPSSRHVLVASELLLHLGVWTLQDKSKPALIRQPKFHDRGAAFNRGDGSRLAVLRRVAGRDHVSVHGADDGFAAELLGFKARGDAADLAWAADDASLLLWDRPARAPAVLWYSLKGEVIAEIKDCKSLRALAPSPSGHFHVACGSDGQLWLLSDSTRSLSATLRHCLRTACAEAGGAGAAPPVFRQAAGAGGPADNGGQAYEQVQTSDATHLLEAPPRPDPNDDDAGVVSAAAVAAWRGDELLLATACPSAPSAVWIWDLGALRLAAVLVHRSEVKAFSWEPISATGMTQSRLAIATEDATLLWSQSSSTACALAATGHSLRWRCDGAALLVEDRSGAHVLTVGHGSAASPSAERLRAFSDVLRIVF